VISPYLLAAIAALVAVIAVMGWRMDSLGDQLDAAEAALEVERANVKIVEKYVDKVVEVERTRPVVGAALQRLCHRAGMQRPGTVDAGASADPNDGQTLQGLADDIIACRLNAEQLAGLQEVVRGQQ
jgi:hypothetical protein